MPLLGESPIRLSRCHVLILALDVCRKTWVVELEYSLWPALNGLEPGFQRTEPAGVYLLQRPLYCDGSADVAQGQVRLGLRLERGTAAFGDPGYEELASSSMPGKLPRQFPIVRSPRASFHRIAVVA